MAAKTGGDQDEISDINIVPLVDIILVVLIIFMVTAPASNSAKLDVDLPSAASGESQEGGEPFQVVLTAEGQMLVGGELVSEHGLRTMAEEEAKKNANAAAVITADKELPYGSVVRVMDTVKAAGISKLSVSTTNALEE